MVKVDLFATEFTVDKDDDILIGRFAADKKGITFTPDGQKALTPDQFRAEFNDEYPDATDERKVLSISKPEAYAKGLPDRFNNGYMYAVIT